MPAQTTPLLKVMILSMEYTSEVSGGLGTHVFELANGLSKADCQVTVLARSPQKPTTFQQANLTVHLLASNAANFTSVAKQSLAGSILAFNDDLISKGREIINGGWRPDIIQCYSWLTFHAASRLGQMVGAPVVSVIQYVSEPVERWWGQTPDSGIVQQESLLFRAAKKFITVSESMRRIIQNTYGVPDDRIRVIYNGMDPQPFINPDSKPDVIRRLRQAIAKSNEKIAVFAGRLHPQKGITALLAAAARVVAKYPNVRYLLAGEPDSREFAQTMKRLLDEYQGLRGKITLLGKLPRNQLAALYQVADLALVPSVYEPFGYASIEAMAAGVPVIASNAGGLGEIILHGRTGLLAPVHQKEDEPHIVDVGELADAQLTLLNDEPLSRRLGLAGRQRVLDYFNSEIMVQSTIAAYQDTINTDRQEKPPNKGSVPSN